MNKLINHHTKYIETDGIDEVIQISRKEHYLVHKHAHVPREIYNKAKSRFTNKRRHSFYSTVGVNIRLFESIIYNVDGTVGYYSCFLGNHETKLIDIQER